MKHLGWIPKTAEAGEIGDKTPEQLIACLKAANQWPANYDDVSDTDGDADDGVSMAEIFQAIQTHCDNMGVVMSNGYGVLDALCAKLQDAPADEPSEPDKKVTIIVT